jgi:hypothetical protein
MKQKTCSRCSVEKPLEAFKKNAMGRLGRHSVCKECCSARVNTEPKVCKDCGEKKPASAFSNKGKHPYCRPCHNERSYVFKRGNGREAHNARMSAYQKRKWETDPEFRQKALARSAVNRAVKAGILKKPEACPTCGRRVRLHGHHHNGYSREHRLDIEWVCAKCHYQAEIA